jgi:hypothetical protein
MTFLTSNLIILALPPSTTPHDTTTERLDR